MASKKYALVPMEDDTAPQIVPRRHKSHKKSTERKPDRSPRRESEPYKKSRRRQNENYEDRWGDEEYSDIEEPEFEESAPKRVKVDHSEAEDEDEEERARRLDKEERDAFAQRLQSKGKKTEPKASLASQRIAMEDTQDLRLRSRQQYLQKRGAEQIALLRKQVAEDNEELRSGVRLSDRERRDFEKRRETLRNAEEYQRIDDHTEGYVIPGSEKTFTDSKAKEAALNKRHIERDEYGQEKLVTEYDIFEREQTNAARSQIKRAERTEVEGEYEYLLDPEQQIKFISMDGNAQKTKEQRELLAKIEAVESKQLSMEEIRKSLPTYAYKQAFIDAMAEHQIIVVVGETGSGKTTQLTQYMAEAGYCKDGRKIGCTQPRRVAAMSVAARVAEEMSVRLGDEVGYSVRFDDKSSDKTMIKYMTDGILLRECFGDPSLEQYSVLVIDEAHERTVSTDVLLCLLKDLCVARPELKIVISSATMNSAKFSAYFNDCPVFNIPGRKFHVEQYHTEAPEANYISAALSTAIIIAVTQPPGDILIFLTGEDEIVDLEQQLTEATKDLGNRIQEIIIAPIYAALSSELQQKIFEPTPKGARKIVLATNIAETSLTIDGISYVIDPGFAKENVYNPATGIQSLMVTPISRASAGQRSGRAGRVAAGSCFKLYTKWSYMNELPEETTPEILRTSLDGVILSLAALGITDLLGFDWIDKPADESIIQSLNKLYSIGAFDSQGTLTARGRRMAELPLDVCQSASIIAADKYECTEEVVTICAMLAEGSTLWIRSKKDKILADSARARFTDKVAGDFGTLLNVFRQWEENDYSPIWSKENFLQQRSLTRARDVRDQIIQLCDRIEVSMSSCGSNVEPFQKAFCAGFFAQAAVLQRGGDSYRTLKGNNTIYIHPSSVLMGKGGDHVQPPKMLVYYELVETSKQYMRNCMPVKSEWLSEVAPHYHKQKDLVELEDKKVPKERR